MYVKRRTGSGIIDMTQDNGTTWTTVTVTSSWTRVSIASTTAANPTVGIRIRTSGDAIDVFGMQHELGAFITSVIPTTTASATRTADVASVSTQAFPYSSTEGTLVANADIIGALSSGSNNVLASFNDGTLSNTHVLYQTTTTPTTLTNASGAPQQTMLVSSVTVVLNQPYKLAFAYKENDFAATANGSTVVTDTSGLVPSGITTLELGAYTGLLRLNGHIRQITYIPRRLTNAELQARTA